MFYHVITWFCGAKDNYFRYILLLYMIYMMWFYKNLCEYTLYYNLLHLQFLKDFNDGKYYSEQKHAENWTFYHFFLPRVKRGRILKSLNSLLLMQYLLHSNNSDIKWKFDNNAIIQSIYFDVIACIDGAVSWLPIFWMFSRKKVVELARLHRMPRFIGKTVREHNWFEVNGRMVEWAFVPSVYSNSLYIL